MNRLTILISALAISTIIGCTSSRGSLYQETAQVEKRQTENRSASAERSEAAEPEEVGLEVRSRPRGAEVYLDDRYMGNTPLHMEYLQPGRYRLSVEKQGYQPYDTWIDYNGGYLSVHADLQTITGYLQIESSPPRAVIEIDGRTLSSGELHALAAGTHRARIRLFGYEDYGTVVRVVEGATTRLQVALSEATLRLEALPADPPAFNPQNSGRLGRTRIRFQVSSHGSGLAVVRDAAGLEVWKQPIGRFTTWVQEVEWDGRASSGTALPDGSYTLVVEAVPERSGGPVSVEVPLRIDRSLRLSYRLPWSGGAGLLYVPSPEVLPRGTSQASTLAVAHLEPAGEGISFRMPWDLGLRIAVGEGNRMEADLHGGLILGYGEVIPWFAGVALKRTLLPPGRVLESAALIKAACQTVRTDSFASFSGLSAGLPVSLSLGPVRLFVSPELTLSLWEVSYSDEEWPPPALTAWGYAKGGLALELDSWTVGLSAAARTLPFRRGFGVDLPVQGGLELHWMIPDTRLFATAALTGEARSTRDWYLSGGFGVGLLD